MRKARAMVMGLASMALAGCGARGSYQGRSVWSMTLDGKTENLEQVDVRQLMPGARSDVVIVSADCDLPADLRGDGLVVLPTTCITWKGDTQTELTFSGGGA